MNNNNYIRYRILDIKGPKISGNVDQFRDFVVKIEFEENSFKNNTIKVIHIKASEFAFTLLGGVDNEFCDNSRVKSLLIYYIIINIPNYIKEENNSIIVNISHLDIEELKDIDTQKVKWGDWQELPSVANIHSKYIFISCGQQTEEEKFLGKQIAKIAKENTGINGYFAEDQHDLEGVTRNIFNAIHNAVAFIAIIHRRDNLPSCTNEYRGSVWIEQEIAIASFIVQSLGLSLPARIYVQKGIKREGVRGYIHINPIEFNSDNDILNDLSSFWDEFQKLKDKIEFS